MTNQRESGRHHLVLFDGVCGLCNGLVRFFVQRDRAGVFHFASLQSATGRAWLTRFGRNAEALDTLVVIADYQRTQPRIHVRSDAALFIAAALPRPWPALAVLRALPRAIRNFVYDGVARWRYRAFGRYDVCPAPAPEHRSRFIDP